MVQARVALNTETPVLSRVRLNSGGATLTLKNSTQANRLDQLSDVSEISPANNMTLVYRSTTDTYVTDYLDLDGGSF